MPRFRRNTLKSFYGVADTLPSSGSPGQIMQIPSNLVAMWNWDTWNIAEIESGYEYGPIIFANLNYIDDTHSPWEGQYTGSNNFSVQSVGDSVEFTKAGMFTINAGGDYWTSPNNGSQSARSEIQLFDTAQAHSTMYYSWYIKIDSSYVESSDWQIIGQFHDQPDPSIGENWSTYPAHSPTVSYQYRNGNFMITAYSFDTSGVVTIATVPMSKGVWHRVVSKIRWSPNSDGTLEVWLDNVPVEAPNGMTKYTAANCFNRAGNYLKVGLYRSMAINTFARVYFAKVQSSLTLQ